MKAITLSYKTGIYLFLIFASIKVSAQQLNMDVRDVDGNIRVYDPASANEKKLGSLAYADVLGSPFWDENWHPAIIYFNNGTKAKINQARLNLYTDEIHYINSLGTELVVENEGITKLVFLNKNNLTQPIALFVKLTNHVTEAGTAFYRVLNTGLYQLLLLEKQFVKTGAYDPMQGKNVSSFYAKKNYAIYNEGKLTPLRDLDRSNILSATPSNMMTTDWLKDKKTKLKTEKEVVDYLVILNLSYAKIGEKQ